MRRALVLSILLSALCGTASAQWHYHESVLETRIDQAGTVFRGVVVGFEEEPPGPNAGVGDNGSATLTVRVDETIKGRPGKTVKLVRPMALNAGRFMLWKKEGIEALWFIELPKGGAAWDAVRLGPKIEGEPFDPNLSFPGILSEDLTLLRTKEEILRRAKAYAKKSSVGNKVFEMWFPKSIEIHDAYYGEGHFHVSFPVNAEFEKTARRMIEAPETFRQKDPTPADNTWIRSQGIRALAYFPSKENTELLRRYLNDPGKGFSTTTYTQVHTWYWTRLAAYDVLIQWGEKVEKPDLGLFEELVEFAE